MSQRLNIIDSQHNVELFDLSINVSIADIEKQENMIAWNWNGAKLHVLGHYQGKLDCMVRSPNHALSFKQENSQSD